MSTMKKTMIYLPADLHRFLADEAERRGVSMAELVREAVGEYRTRAEAPVRNRYEAIVGIVDDPAAARLSEHVDDALAAYYRPGGEWDREHGLADPH